MGIDVGAQHLDFRLLDDQAEPITEAQQVPNTNAGIGKLLRSLPDSKQTQVYFEATGVYTVRLIEQLTGKVAGLYQINPKLIRNNASTMVSTKTDAADARAIADAGHTLCIKKPAVLQRFAVHYDVEDQNLGIWLAEYDRLRKAIVRLRLQRQSLTHHPAPAAKKVIKQMDRQLAQLIKDQKQAGQQIEQHSQTPDVELVESIKSIGRKTAATVCRKIGSIDRFDHVDSLKAYLAIYPSRRQSGGRERRARMAKHGNKLVRHMLWNCAKSAARWNPPCRQLFERMIANGKTAPAAYGAVMRKLVQIIYGVLKSKTPWNPNHHLTING
jgi:transposase